MTHYCSVWVILGFVEHLHITDTIWAIFSYLVLTLTIQHFRNKIEIIWIFGKRGRKVRNGGMLSWNFEFFWFLDYSSGDKTQRPRHVQK